MMDYRKSETAEAVTLNPRAKPLASVIWLHGLGADGHDFVPLVPELQLPDSTGIRFTFPHAPVRPVTINGGMRMRAWYDIVGLSARTTEDDAGIQASSALVRDWIEREVSSGVAANRVIVAGFSQGGAIALHAALRYPEALGGVVALSSYRPRWQRLTAEAAPANRSIAILMCHGTFDAVVPLELGTASRDTLLAAGYAVSWQTYPMQHQVCGAEISKISDWLRSRVGRHTAEASGQRDTP